MIATLIDGPDNFEVIRDRITTILSSEVESQKALATAAGKDPSLWDLRVYQERSNIMAEFDDGDDTPVVTVRFDRSTLNASASNSTSRQQTAATYAIAVVGAGANTIVDEGQLPGDRMAAHACQRALRLVRNILMSSEYAKLGMTGTVSKRWIDDITVFQPPQDNANVLQVVGAVISFRVEFNEFSPQAVPTTLETVNVEATYAPSGQVIFSAEFDYTA